MSQSIITLAFETYKAQQEAIAAPIELNEFVLAFVPNQDPTQPIDRNEELPPQHQIVHVANVTQGGFVNPNAVVYSLIMDTRIGDFEFNWVGLRNKQSGVLASILHIPTISKFKSVPGVQNGNSVTRSILMSYQDAKNATGITVDASTLQIDFTARLFGMDEAERLVNLDVFGQAAFLADGFKVKKSGSTYLASIGRGYVGGLRCHLDNEVAISGGSNSSAIYLDASWQGLLTSQWQTVFEMKVSKSALSDYVDADGYQHYVTKIADINSAGNVVDTRHVEGFSEHLRHDEQATKAQAEAMTSSINWISPLRWKEAFLSRLSNSFAGTRTEYAASEKALSDGLRTKANSSHKHDASDVNSGILAKERLPNASTAVKGAVQLNDTVTSTSTTQALTANKGKSIWDRANEALNAAHAKWTYVVASTTVYGATKLSSATNSTSEALAATSGALKKTYDLAASKITKVQGDLWYWKRGETVTNSTQLNGKTNSTAATGGTIAERDSSGDISTRLFRSSYQDESVPSGGLAFRKSTSDNSIRFCNNIAAIRTWLSVYSRAEGDSRYVAQSRVSSSTTSTSTTNVANSAAAKAAMDRANAAYNKADTSGNKVYTGDNPNNINFPIGHFITAWVSSYYGRDKLNHSVKCYLNNNGSIGIYGTDWYGHAKGAYLNGTWGYRGYTGSPGNVNAGLMQRVL